MSEPDSKMYPYHAYASDRLHNSTTVPCNLKKRKKRKRRERL